IIVTLVVITAVMILTMEVTSRPKFCSTCHYMKPYYASWQESSHSEVTCTDCHFPPGIKSKIKGKLTALSMLVNYFTGVYKKGKPWAEISDESCMRGGCHDTKLLSGKTLYKKNIIFDHTPHLTALRRGKKLRCTGCHSQIVQGSHLSVTESTCFLCHFKGVTAKKEINRCTKCHEPPVAEKGADTPVVFDHKQVMEKKMDCWKCHGEMVVGDGAVPKNRCSNCHAELDKLKRYDDTEFMHKNHITDHKVECERCHTEIQHKSVARTEFVKPDCHSCHPDFHKAQLYLFTGSGGKGLPKHPSPMFDAGLNCQACHIYHDFADDFKEKGETFAADAKSCDPCHGEGYHKILSTWKQQTSRKLSQVDNVLKTAKKTIAAKKNNAAYPEAEQALKDALYNYNLVKFGKSIHNIAFANQLLEKSYLLAEESLKMLNITARLPYFERESKLVPGECSNCHAGVERTEKRVFGWVFPHYKHLITEGLTCTRCHSHQRKHGELIIRKQDCMSCHHKDKQKQCKECHEIQDAIYFSKLAFSTLDMPNVMAEDVSCGDCHQDEQENIFRPGKENCSNCHDKEYEDFFSQWQEDSLELLERLREKVRRGNLRRGDKAYDTLLFLEKDGSKGIHNPELYQELIEEALK
ncbi:MAG: NapC/NirT family cytochrome c, partial [Candidatus Aminicenantes bacterium]|nr:NapC/NirT family cytochrome c [Candidatus Aminicenantes bacterium]